MAKTFNLIIPCFNEGEMIELLYNEIEKVIKELPQYNFNYLFIDDGSKDNTLELIKVKADSDARVKYVSFSRNFGKESSMLAGLEFSDKMKVDGAIIMDADLQDPPSLLFEFFKYYEEGYKYIFTRNKTRKGQAFLKRVFSNLFYKVYAFFTGDKNSVSSARDFALLDKEVIKAFLAYKDKKRYTKGISSNIGFKRKYIEYEYHNRAAGKTKWSFKKLFKYGVNGIEQFSHLYIAVPNIISFVLASVSLGFMVYYLIEKIPFVNWVNFFIFIAAFFISIIGQFVIKLLYDVRDQLLERPHYLTEDTNVEL